MKTLKYSVQLFSLFLGVVTITAGEDVNLKNNLGLTTGTGSSSEIIVGYTIWAEEGDNPAAFQANIRVNVPTNATLFQVMQRAREVDSAFEFSSRVYSGLGNYITCLCGLCESPDENRYWMIFQTPAIPDPAQPPGNNLLTPRGVDGMIVKNGDEFLFWLHHYVWHN
ncbi:hypothetical protein B566_EDAN015011 [Ephemera danica]|nr:hypothetical protein B566_EDAN015011 [Ephemera danica]